MPTAFTPDEINLLDYALRLALHEADNWAQRQEQALALADKPITHIANSRARRAAKLLRDDHIARIEALTRKLDLMLTDPP